MALQDRAQLEKRIAELEAENALLRGGTGRRGFRYDSSLSIAGLPLVSIASGPDFDRKQARGHARGVIAVGDIATGVIAVGGVVRGLVAVGGVALGVVTMGGISIGALVAVGGLAIGTLALGGGAIGGAAVGGGAAGYYACGGAVAGVHTIGPGRADREAIAFFSDYRLEGLCVGGKRRW